MTLNSMTGFARADGALGATSWHWEVRSVNGRGLDVRMRLPPGYEGFEQRIRDAAAKVFARGSLMVTLVVKRQEGVSEIRLNEVALAQVLAAAQRVRAIAGGEPPRVDALLSIRGVLEIVEARESEQEAEQRMTAMFEALEAAFAGVAASRAAEGSRLAAILSDQLAQIEDLVSAIAAAPARRPEIVRQRLKEQVARVLEASSKLDEARLNQEAAMLATRLDIEEEMKRLMVHVQAARDLVASRGAVGRKLDFLSQEFNREANTICSKANDSETTGLGLRLKAVIDQMREQIQNIE
jgi:uncharacterized protein (TIGR00255 family)